MAAEPNSAHLITRLIGWISSRLSRRRRRTPVIMQHEAAECGAVSLAIVLAHFGRWTPLSELREACSVGRDGSNAGDLARAATSYGLEASGWRRQPRQLRGMPLPMILFWEFRHFLVLEGFGKGRYYLNDPANGRRTVSEEEFSQSFTGVVLTLQPGTEFRAGGEHPSILRQLWPWLRDVKGPLAFATLCGLMLALPGLILPVLLSMFVDHVMPNPEASLGLFIIAAAVFSSVLIYLLTWLQQRCLRRIFIRVSVIHSDRFLSHLLRLPLHYFARRFAGDLTARARLIDQVSEVATNQLVGAAIELVMIVMFLALMLYYDLLLAVIVAALGVMSVVLIRIVARLRTDENHRLARERGLLSGIGMAGLRNMDSMRAAAAEGDFFTRWSGYQARELVARQRFAEFGYVTAALPETFQLLAAAAVFALGGWRVMSGDMSVGSLMVFYVLAGSFLRPLGNFVQLADQLQVLEAELRRMDDVLDTPKDPLADADDRDTPGRVATSSGRLRLAGKIELRDVTFGYQPNRPPLLQNFNLTIEPGQRVAVIGPTGSGKSTLALLATGAYRPWSGEVLFDGQRIDEIPRVIFTDSVSIVDQRVVLFDATVRDNLTLWNPTTPDYQVFTAAQDALIHDEILSRSFGYDSRVEEGGRNFSGGQRQRLEIARAITGNPSVLVLDEATSALDTISEERIDSALRRRGCTCLIVAHRLSTIRDCDLIVVLERGREVQRGTHDELIADESGLYHRLVHAN